MANEKLIDSIVGLVNAFTAKINQAQPAQAPQAQPAQAPQAQPAASSTTPAKVVEQEVPSVELGPGWQCGVGDRFEATFHAGASAGQKIGNGLGLAAQAFGTGVAAKMGIEWGAEKLAGGEGAVPVTAAAAAMCRASASPSGRRFGATALEPGEE